MTEELQHEGEEQPHLLLVDDDPTFTRVMARAMGRRGLHVSIAGSAEEGLEMAKQDLPDYAVLDLKMEGDSGLVLLPKLLELGFEPAGWGPQKLSSFLAEQLALTQKLVATGRIKV